MIEDNKQTESGFKILNLLLLESTFKREVNVTFNNAEVQNNVDVSVNVQIKDNIIFVTETVKFDQIFNQITEVSITVKMVGMFEKHGVSELDSEAFGNVNGAAIIFPYIREHITNLSTKAGLGMILLPPFNFTKKSS